MDQNWLGDRRLHQGQCHQRFYIICFEIWISSSILKYILNHVLKIASKAVGGREDFLKLLVHLCYVVK